MLIPFNQDFARAMPTGSFIQPTSRDRAIAEFQLQEVLAIEQLISMDFKKRYAAAIRSAAILSIESGNTLLLDSFDMSSTSHEFSSILQYVFLSSYQSHQGRGTFVSTPLSANLSRLTKEIKRIGSQIEINVGILSKNLDAIADRTLRSSLHDVKRRINAELQLYAKLGLTKRQQKIKLGQKLIDMGFAPSSSSYIDTLVNTFTQFAYNTAQRVVFRADPAIWGFVYVNQGDNRVRAEHEKLGGIIKPRDHEVWGIIWPPNGWNCRCQVAPLYTPHKTTRLPNHVESLVDEDFRFDSVLELAV